FSNARHERRRVTLRQRSAAQPRRQTAAFDEAHRKEMLPVVLADFENRHDARVIEPGACLGFKVETLDLLIGSPVPCLDHLESDKALQLVLPGLVHHPHAAASNLL